MINSFFIIQRNDKLQFMFYQNINLFLMWFIQQKLWPNKSMQNLSAPGEILEKVVKSISTKDTFLKISNLLSLQIT